MFAAACLVRGGVWETISARLPVPLCQDVLSLARPAQAVGDLVGLLHGVVDHNSVENSGLMRLVALGSDVRHEGRDEGRDGTLTSTCLAKEDGGPLCEGCLLNASCKVAGGMGGSLSLDQVVRAARRGPVRLVAVGLRLRRDIWIIWSLGVVVVIALLLVSRLWGVWHEGTRLKKKKSYCAKPRRFGAKVGPRGSI